MRINPEKQPQIQREIYQISRKVARKVTSTKKDAQNAVDCVLDTITKTLKKKEDVTLVGFDTFKVTKRKARIGRNPKTGEEIKIQAKNVPTFSAGKALRDAVA